MKRESTTNVMTKVNPGGTEPTWFPHPPNKTKVEGKLPQLVVLPEDFVSQ